MSVDVPWLGVGQMVYPWCGPCSRPSLCPNLSWETACLSAGREVRGSERELEYEMAT